MLSISPYALGQAAATPPLWCRGRSFFCRIHCARIMLYDELCRKTLNESKNKVKNENWEEEKYWIKVGIVLLTIYYPFFLVMTNLDTERRTKKKAPMAQQIIASPIPTIITVNLNSNIVGLSSGVAAQESGHSRAGSFSTAQFVITVQVGKNTFKIYQDQNGNEIRREFVTTEKEKTR